jgi:ligand-binding sensor domain-containing protein/serine phosphatase RsbU (regulator of sigma subunit)
MYLIKQFFFTFLLLIASLSYVQAQSLNFNQFGIEDGMPQSSITALSNDTLGNIWVGTMSGVTGYNGVTFTTYNRLNGLHENRVSALHITPYQQLIVGHTGGGISVINITSKKISKITFGIIDINTPVTSIITDKNEGLWIATLGQGILYYKPSDSELRNHEYTGRGSLYKISLSNYNALRCNQITIANNAILAATDDGLYKIKITKGNMQAQRLILNDVFIGSLATSIAVFNNKIYAGTNNKGVLSFDINGTSLIKNYTATDGLPDVYIKSLYASNKALYVGTNSKGACKLIHQLEQQNYKGAVFQQINANHGLSNDKVNCFTEDNEKNIWIGTVFKLNQYFDEQFEIYGTFEGLKNTIVWSVINDKKDNSLWLGTDGGLYHMTTMPNSNQNKFELINDNYSSSLKNTTALYQDNNGKVWYSNYGQGVNIYNPATKLSASVAAIPCKEVYAITADAAQNIWIATNREGVFCYNPITNALNHYTIANGLGGNNVYQLFADSKNNIWAAVLGGKLSMWNGTKWTTYTERNNYPSDFTLSITEDKNHTLWLGTYEHGLYKYANGKFTNETVFKDKQSLIYLLKTDVQNNLWIGTPTGIDKLNISTNDYKHYNKYDGFLGVEINPNSVCNDADNNIWLGTIIGLVKYKPNAVRSNNKVPILSLGLPLVNFKKQLVNADTEYDYNENQLTFEFVGASLTRPKEVVYQYYLDGFDKTWLPIAQRNTVTYNNLPAGTYTFMVRAANDNMKWSDVKQYRFVITPPFYRTWWFYTLAIVGILSIIGIVFVTRTRRLRKLNKILETKVTLRTQELNAEKENVELQKIELERKNINITDSIDYAKRIQDSLFVTENEIESELRNAFIFFQPKDIVSGDFYWLKRNDNNLYFALADCTGHGVPGAMMSIMGYNLLNEIITNATTALSPADVLTLLKNRLSTQLNKHHNDDAMLQDGMDIALCTINFDKKELVYAGAFMPLYLVRNNEIIEHKANKIPIGKMFFKTTEENYTNHTIALQQGDVIYLSSDGYVDQRGGEAGKKFYPVNFKKLLVDINTKPMRMQVALLHKALNDFKGNSEQIDDITVMGVKVD